MSTKQYAYFSAAIRDGAKLRPQGFGQLISGGATCALGAGYEAVLGTAFPRTAEEIVRQFPYLNERDSCCPVEDCGWLESRPFSTELLRLLAHLNDEHHWTREAIADWLYAEEEKLGFVTISDETEAHKPQVGFINNVTEAQAGVLTKRF